MDQLLSIEIEKKEADLKAKSEEAEALAEVEDDIKTKEELLKKLRNTLLSYHDKSKYEALIKEVEVLEIEKKKLTTQQQPEDNNGDAISKRNSANENLRERLKVVESQLNRLKGQKKEQEHIYRVAERQNQKMKELEESISKLKQAKVQQIKKQKQAIETYREYKMQKAKELEILRKSSRQKSDNYQSYRMSADLGNFPKRKANHSKQCNLDSLKQKSIYLVC